MTNLDPYHTAKDALVNLALELDDLSRKLTHVNRDLEPVERQVKDFLRDYELGLYHQSVQNKEFKLPAEKLREQLAIAALPPELYGRWLALTAKRDEMKRRIGDIKTEVESWRSVLSAEKTELEAASPGYRSAQPQWSATSRGVG